MLADFVADHRAGAGAQEGAPEAAMAGGRTEEAAADRADRRAGVGARPPGVPATVLAAGVMTVVVVTVVGGVGVVGLRLSASRGYGQGEGRQLRQYGRSHESTPLPRLLNERVRTRVPATCSTGEGRRTGACSLKSPRSRGDGRGRCCALSGSRGRRASRRRPGGLSRP